MQLNQWLLIGIIVVPLAFVMLGRLRMDLAALLMAILLGILQFAGVGMLGAAHTPGDALKAIAGFSQPVVITLISLFIITRGLEKSGVTRWIAQKIVRVGGKSPRRFIALFTLVAATLSLFMNNLAAGALLLPSAMEVARRTGIKPSKLLIPVAYGSLLGGAATYFTTANIIMSDLLRIAKPPQQPLGILSFTPTGGLIAIAGILFLWLLGDRLLPEREPSPEQSLARLTGRELENLYEVGQRLWKIQVRPESGLVGEPLSKTELGQKYGVAVVVVERDRHVIPNPDPSLKIEAGDFLWIVSREDAVTGLAQIGLEIFSARAQSSLSQMGVTFAEVMLTPHSTLQGMTLKQIGFRKRYHMTIVAIKRGARTYRTNVGDLPLELGDSLLVAGEYERIQALRHQQDFILFVPSLQDKPIEKKPALLTIMITLLAIAASIAGVPVTLSVLAGAVITLLLKILPLEEAYQSIEWQAVFLIAGMYAVSQAMVQTGLAQLMGSSLLSVVAHFGPLGVAAGSYLLTALLTQFMGGQVTALVTGPVTISAAISMGINPQAVAVATAIGCSASFFTPMAHPVNILMMAPGNYKFSDFLRAGWLLTIVCFVMLLLGMALLWGL